MLLLVVGGARRRAACSSRWIEVSNAAREGAAYAAGNPTDTTGITTTPTQEAQLPGPGRRRHVVTVTAACARPGEDRRSPARLRRSAATARATPSPSPSREPFSFVTPLIGNILGSSVSLTGYRDRVAVFGLQPNDGESQADDCMRPAATAAFTRLAVRHDRDPRRVRLDAEQRPLRDRVLRLGHGATARSHFRRSSASRRPTRTQPQGTYTITLTIEQPGGVETDDAHASRCRRVVSASVVALAHGDRDPRRRPPRQIPPARWSPTFSWTRAGQLGEGQLLRGVHGPTRARVLVLVVRRRRGSDFGQAPAQHSLQRPRPVHGHAHRRRTARAARPSAQDGLPVSRRLPDAGGAAGRPAVRRSSSSPDPADLPARVLRADRRQRGSSTSTARCRRPPARRPARASVEASWVGLDRGGLRDHRRTGLPGDRRLPSRPRRHGGQPDDDALRQRGEHRTSTSAATRHAPSGTWTGQTCSTPDARRARVAFASCRPSTPITPVIGQIVGSLSLCGVDHDGHQLGGGRVRSVPRPPATPARRSSIIALSISVIVLLVGIAVDGGYALVQRRSSQNAADFAALAGRPHRRRLDRRQHERRHTTRTSRRPSPPSIASTAAATITFGATGSPVYVSAGRHGARPRRARARSRRHRRRPGDGDHESWAPYFLRIIGVSELDGKRDRHGSRRLLRRSGSRGAVFPVGIAEAFFNHRQPCSGPVITTRQDDPCYPQHLTPGNLNVPGGFGWLKFGCDGYGLGQVAPANAAAATTKPLPPGRDRTARQQLRLLHAGRPARQHRPHRQPARQQDERRLLLLDRTGQRRCPSPVWDYAGGNGIERLLPHRRLHRLPDHRLQRRQGHRGGLAPAVLPRADDDRSRASPALRWPCS